MLVTFQTDAYESITLFGEVAKRLLVLMGQSGQVPGAILAHDVPDALARLSRAVEQERQRSSKKIDQEPEPDVSLVHRALPVMSLLQAATDKHCDVLWSADV
ncbi:MAG: hypothetical protein CK424_08000 [Legionella sp.]|nr:MAG: hypothetical protein CK424_08000 [Legionella sp.]